MMAPLPNCFSICSMAILTASRRWGWLSLGTVAGGGVELLCFEGRPFLVMELNSVPIFILSHGVGKKARGKFCLK